MTTWQREHYCPDPTCRGATGFRVGWYSDHGTAPEPATDTCPHCGLEMTDEPPDHDPPCTQSHPEPRMPTTHALNLTPLEAADLLDATSDRREFLEQHVADGINPENAADDTASITRLNALADRLYPLTLEPNAA